MCFIWSEECLGVVWKVVRMCIYGFLDHGEVRRNSLIFWIIECMVIWKKLGHKLSSIDINILPAILKLEYTAVECNPRWAATSSSESRLLPPQRVESSREQGRKRGERRVGCRHKSSNGGIE